MAGGGLDMKALPLALLALLALRVPAQGRYRHAPCYVTPMWAGLCGGQGPVRGCWLRELCPSSRARLPARDMVIISFVSSLRSSYRVGGRIRKRRTMLEAAH